MVALTDYGGAIVARYTYDAWGKLLTVTDANGNDVSNNATHIANINPLRYRSYYYDTESGFYYLTSRYYDPTVGRFINADAYVSTGQGYLGYNMFVYCNNNPVNYVDYAGTRAGHLGPTMVYINDGGYRSEKSSESLSALEVLEDMGSIFLKNFSASAGLSMGMSFELEGPFATCGVTPVRMDIVGVQFREGELKVGHPGHSGSSVSVGLLEFGKSNDVFESFGGDEYITYGDGDFDVSLSYGLSFAFLIGGHYDVSISISGIVNDVIEYIHLQQEGEI